MHIRLIAVGDRQPAWVGDAFERYARRMPRQWQFRLEVIATARRAGPDDGARAMAAEGRQVLAKIRASERLVVLDERGTQWSSTELARRLEAWQTGGDDLAFVIGGPDGVAAECLQRAECHWSLSKLTLPHGLTRVLVAEQLYRAWTVMTGHPYHRAGP